ncbi:hypothetical protein HK098_002187 [Nowakowskiella sp. JEL0407]|nr:hypothetical protein HK098_002187 [Nowakowskiella sp. JEL0407]
MWGFFKKKKDKSALPQEQPWRPPTLDPGRIPERTGSKAPTSEPQPRKSFHSTHEPKSKLDPGTNLEWSHGDELQSSSSNKSRESKSTDRNSRNAKPSQTAKNTKPGESSLLDDIFSDLELRMISESFLNEDPYSQTTKNTQQNTVEAVEEAKTIKSYKLEPSSMPKPKKSNSVSRLSLQKMKRNSQTVEIPASNSLTETKNRLAERMNSHRPSSPKLGIITPPLERGVHPSTSIFTTRTASRSSLVSTPTSGRAKVIDESESGTESESDASDDDDTTAVPTSAAQLQRQTSGKRSRTQTPQPFNATSGIFKHTNSSQPNFPTHMPFPAQLYSATPYGHPETPPPNNATEHLLSKFKGSPSNSPKSNDGTVYNSSPRSITRQKSSDFPRTGDTKKNSASTSESTLNDDDEPLSNIISRPPVDEILPGKNVIASREKSVKRSNSSPSLYLNTSASVGGPGSVSGANGVQAMNPMMAYQLQQQQLLSYYTMQMQNPQVYQMMLQQQMMQQPHLQQQLQQGMMPGVGTGSTYAQRMSPSPSPTVNQSAFFHPHLQGGYAKSEYGGRNPERSKSSASVAGSVRSMRSSKSVRK